MISQDFAMLAAALPLAGFASYIRDTLRGRTRPNRVSWSLWAVAPLIAFAAELAQHTSLRVALVTFTLGFGPLLVAAASFAGRGSYWKLTRFDFLCGSISAAALVLWAVTGRGDVAICFSILADGFAAVPTIAKSARHPGSESAATYLASGTGSGITLLTIPHWTFSNYAFPLYAMAVCAVISALILLPRQLSSLQGRPASRRIRLAAASGAALGLLAAAGFASYQLRSASGRMTAQDFGAAAGVVSAAAIVLCIRGTLRVPRASLAGQYPAAARRALRDAGFALGTAAGVCGLVVPAVRIAGILTSPQAAVPSVFAFPSGASLTDHASVPPPGPGSPAPLTARPSPHPSPTRSRTPAPRPSPTEPGPSTTTATPSPTRTVTPSPSATPPPAVSPSSPPTATATATPTYGG